MKKLIIFFGILFLVDAVYGQSPLKPVKIDSLVTVSLPVAHTKKDTLGQSIFSATTDFGYMIAIMEPNAKGNQPLQKEKDLNSVLKKYISGIQSQSQGSAQFVRDTTIGTLKAKAFTLLTKDANGDNQYRNFILLYTKDATYTFEYGYPEVRKDMVKGESKAFFNSIRLSPELQRNDQYTDTRKSTGLSTNFIIAIAGGIIIIALVLWLIFRKKKMSNKFA
jgi:LPXTG-motif cell wall-anchored protein